MSEAERWPNDCGGCAGLGNHRRWCRAAVGGRAAMLGKASQQAEDLADTIGANMPEAANAAYRLAGTLQQAANEAALQFIAQQVTEEVLGEPNTEG